MKTAKIFDPLGDLLGSFKYDPQTLQGEESTATIPMVILTDEHYKKVEHAFKFTCFVEFEDLDGLYFLVGLSDAFPERKEDGSFVVHLTMSIRTGWRGMTIENVSPNLKTEAMCGWIPIDQITRHETWNKNPSYIFDNGVRVGEGVWSPDDGPDNKGVFAWVDDDTNEGMNPQPLYYRHFPNSFKNRYS